LDFNIRTVDARTESVLFSHSKSNIHGALGDDGQNYKSIAYLLKGLEEEHGLNSRDLRVAHGCSTAPVATNPVRSIASTPHESEARRVAAAVKAGPAGDKVVYLEVIAVVSVLGYVAYKMCTKTSLRNSKRS
jgi:hypothetical protein